MTVDRSESIVGPPHDPPLPARVPQRTEEEFVKRIVGILLVLAVRRDWLSRAQVHTARKDLMSEPSEVGYYPALLAGRGYVESESAWPSKVSAQHRLLHLPDPSCIWPPRVPENVVVDEGRAQAMEERFLAVLALATDPAADPKTLLALIQDVSPGLLRPMRRPIQSELRTALIEAEEELRSEAPPEDPWLNKRSAFVSDFFQLMKIPAVRLERVHSLWRRELAAHPEGWQAYLERVASRKPSFARLLRLLEGGEHAELLKDAGSWVSPAPSRTKA